MTLDHDTDRDVTAVTYDRDDGSVVVVIGSGAGGAVLANELCHKGIDVVILEAGRHFDESEFENDLYAMDEKLSWRDKRAFTGTSVIGRDFPKSPLLMCKAVGGSTLHWAALCPRLRDYEFETATVFGAIPGTGIADWPFGLEEMAPYYDRAEDRMGVTGTHGIPSHPPGNNYKVMAAGARRVGYSQVGPSAMAINTVPRDGRNACDQIGFCTQGCASGAKWTTANSELPRAESTGRCELRAECMALKIEHDASGRVSGVVYADEEGRHQLQKARLVCVACNSIETVRLLLNSESSTFPDGLANASGMVGAYYMRHVVGNSFAEFAKPVGMHRGVQVGGLVYDEARHDPERGFAGGFNILGVNCGLPAYAATLDPSSWGRAYADWIEAHDHIAMICFCGEDLAMEGNKVSLHASEKDQYGLPIPCLHIDDHQNEVAMKSYAFRKIRELFEAIGARRVLESHSEVIYHHLGVCRMSEKPRDGVVNPWGQAHDIPNLFVSDGSQFPSSGAANPTLTIVALAIRQAEYIAEKMRGNEI